MASEKGIKIQSQHLSQLLRHSMRGPHPLPEYLGLSPSCTAKAGFLSVCAPARQRVMVLVICVPATHVGGL